MSGNDCRSTDLTRDQQEEIRRDGGITSALVNAVADKVYAQLLQDVMLERERFGPWGYRKEYGESWR